MIRKITISLFQFKVVVLLISIFLSLGFFLVDIHAPLGIAGGIPYIFVVAMGYLMRDCRLLTSIIILSLILTWVGYFISPVEDGVGDLIPIINRMLASAAIIITGLFASVGIRRDNRLSQEIKNRIRSENELKQIQRNLEFSNEELEAFTYSVSHDLKAPLRSIIGFSEALKEYLTENDIDDTINDYLEKINRNGLKLNRFIDELLKYSRVNAKEMVMNPLNTIEVFREIIDDYFQDRKSIIKINDLLPIVGDGIMLEHVFMNLISNAIKYSSKEEKPKIVISARETGHEIIISIKDNGAGFDMSKSERLFKVFQRLHEDGEFQGAGVGLPICKKIMERHGGRLWGESQGLGKGATFFLAFKKPEIRILAKAS